MSGYGKKTVRVDNKVDEGIFEKDLIKYVKQDSMNEHQLTFE